jgi:DNA polymerase I
VFFAALSLPRPGATALVGQMAKWLLIDGFNLAYRCFHAVPELTRADGFPTNALHGWVKSLWKLADQEKPAGTLVFFDLDGSHERQALLPEYKAQREEMPAALRQQIEPIKALTRAMGYVGVEHAGVESDDVLASQAVALANQGHTVLIVSSDKDFAQIVDDRIKILLPPPSANPKLGWQFRDHAAVVGKFGVPPAQIADYLALVGDSSDNIPGISGVGPKTAVKWLQRFGNIEGVIAHAAELEPERFRAVVSERADDLRRNLKLTTLNLALPTVAAQPPSVDSRELFKLLEGFEMKGSLNEARSRYGQPEFLF